MHLPFSLDICDCPAFPHIFMALFRVKEKNLHQPFLPDQENYFVSHTESWDSSKHKGKFEVGTLAHALGDVSLLDSIHPSLINGT